MAKDAKSMDEVLAGAERVIVVDPTAQAQAQFRRDMEELSKNPLDRAKKRGGYFLNSDGSGAHDANGDPVDMDPADKDAAKDAQRRATLNKPVGSGPGLLADSPEEQAALAAKQAGALGGGEATSRMTLADTKVKLVEEDQPEPAPLDLAEKDDRVTSEADKAAMAEKAKASGKQQGKPK